jgi:hypothetical protein
MELNNQNELLSCLAVINLAQNMYDSQSCQNVDNSERELINKRARRIDLKDSAGKSM